MFSRILYTITIPRYQVYQFWKKWIPKAHIPSLRRHNHNLDHYLACRGQAMTGGRVLYKAPSTAGVHSRLQSRIPYCRVENVTPPKPLARHSSLAYCGMRRLAFKLLAWPRGAVQLARHGSSLAAARPRVQCAAKTRLCGLFSVFFGSLAAGWRMGEGWVGGWYA